MGDALRYSMCDKKSSPGSLSVAAAAVVTPPLSRGESVLLSSAVVSSPDVEMEEDILAAVLEDAIIAKFSCRLIGGRQTEWVTE